MGSLFRKSDCHQCKPPTPNISHTSQTLTASCRIICAIILPIAFFGFGWTSFPSITWVPQVIFSAFIGMSTLVLFWQGANFIIDSYGFYANSAMAINAFIRGIAGAVFPLFAVEMYHSLGVPVSRSKGMLEISADHPVSGRHRCSAFCA